LDATYDGQVEAVQSLAKCGGDAQIDYALEIAIVRGLDEVTEYFQSLGVSRRRPYLIPSDIADDYGQDADRAYRQRFDEGNLAHFLAERGDQVNLKVLLNLEPWLLAEDVYDESDDAHGWTVAHFAARGGHVEMVRFVAEMAANIDAMTEDGDTPIDIAIAHNQHSAEQVLRELGGHEGMDLSVDDDDD